MKGQRYLPILFLSLPALLIIVAILNRKPRYEGKTAYEWVQQIKMPSNPPQPDRVLVALKKVKPSPLPILKEEIKSRQTSHRFKAAWILGQLEDAAKPAIPDLVKALNDKDIGVRINAVHALTQVGARDTNLVPRVLPMLSDANLQLSAEAGDLLNAIARENPGSVSAKAFLNATAPKSRLTGLPLLIDQVKDDEARTPSITMLLNDSNGWVREQTVRFLVARGLAQTNLVLSSRAANLANLLQP
jgi:hypothetical protein